MDSQTKESKDLKFRQWANSIQQTKSHVPKKTAILAEDQLAFPKKTVDPAENSPVSVQPYPLPAESEPEKTEEREDPAENQDIEERKGRESQKSRHRSDAAVPASQKPSKRGKIALIAAIAFFLAFAVILALALLIDRKNRANFNADYSAVEAAAEPSANPVQNQEPSFSPEPTIETKSTEISFTVPAEYSFDGNTEYSLTQEEYDQLLLAVHQYIEEQIAKIRWQKDPYYPHFDSVSVNDNCSVYTVTVNDAGTRSEKELKLPDQLSVFSRMYGAYSRQSIPTFEINYQAQNGTVLKKETVILDAVKEKTGQTDPAPPPPAPN